MTESIKNTKFLILEMIAIFVLIPIVLLLDILIWIKVGVVILGLIYVILSIRKEGLFKKKLYSITWNKEHRRSMFVLWGVFAIVSTTLMYVFYPEMFFSVVVSKPWLWVLILFIYSFLSVLPQEVIYRQFFVKRYRHLFTSDWVFILVNGLIFSLGHIMFKNPLVLGLTFVGGILFCYRYLRTESIVTLSIEHAFYGMWLFTIGMGEMLAFPT